MLITKTIKVPNNGHYKNYLDNGVLDINTNMIEIKVEYLKPSSHIEVNVKCDICGLEKKIEYQFYIKNIKNHNIFTCKGKCCKEKNKLTNLKRYGVENVFQNSDIKEKIKQTNLEKYGAEYSSKNNKIKEKTKQTILKKYGVDNYSKTEEYKEKNKQTNLEKYGVENVFQNIEIQDKFKETNLSRYGVEYGFQNPYIFNKFKKTNLEKYGVEHALQNDFFLDKLKKTNLSRYGVDYFSKSEESRKNFIISNHLNYIKYIDNGYSLFNCDQNKDHYFEIHIENFHGRSNSNLPLCTTCYPIGNSRSLKEEVVFEYIKSVYLGEIIQSYRDGIEIDIYLPDIKLGIEFNGLYWHSNKFIENDYHLNKKEFFKQKEIDIKFIWEDDFDNNFDIIKSKINNWLKLTQNKIYARKTDVKQITNVDDYRNFLNNNHIQGFVASKLVYGLYFENELVSLMSFDKKEGRLNMLENEWNLNRFCNLLNHQVIGGASKLLNHFIKINNPSRIISYADKDWSCGNLYFILGFKLINESKPDYKYVINNIRINKQHFTKAKLDKLGHDISLTESQIMSNLGINRIYDCGKMKFEKIIK